MSGPCPARGCEGVAHRGWTICRTCAHTLEKTIAEIPWLCRHLDISLARQRSNAPRADGGGASDSALPFNAAASAAVDLIRTTLSAWVRELGGEPGPPEVMGAWLLHRVAQLYVHPAAGVAVDDFTSVAGKAHRAVYGPTPRVFLGACTCSADLYASRNEPLARCWDCGSEYDVAERLAQVEAEVATMLLPIRDIVRIAAFLGDFPDTARTEARLNLWAHRGTITKAGTTRDGRPTYSYRDVIGELHRRVAQR